MFVHFLALIDIAEAITQAFRTFFGMLCIPIYNLIEIFYELFSYIARADVLSNGMVEEIYRKVGLILGIFMTFKLIFSLIQALIDPTKLNDKKNGYTSIVFRCLISIVLLGVTPAIFDMAFDLQNAIIGNSENTSNIIYRLIVEDNSNINSNNFGRKLATELYFSFYKQTEGAKWEPGTYLTNNGLVVDTYDNLKKLTEEGKVTYSELAAKLYEDDNNGKYMIEFDGLLCLVVGVFTAYLLLMFCIQTSIRVFQLAYLQLIAPIPIISYISDPEGSFKKWYSQCLSTYLDLFIRLAIVYFIVYLSNYIIAEFNSENISFDTGNSLFNVAVEIFLILGLLLFAKKVPDLIKDLFPNLGGGAGKFSFGLNPKKEVFEPLKQLYNNTPIGWAPKALGWAGKKTIGAIDRKVHNLPKPRSKFGQAIDKLTPGRAEYLKNKREAKIDAKNWDTQEQKGKAIYDQFDGKLTYDDSKGISHAKSGVFKNQNYISTFEAKTNAKNKVKEAEKLVGQLNEDITAASTDIRLTEKQREEKLKVLRAQRENAQSNLRAAEGELTIAEERHKKNQAIYTEDAKRERLFKMYDDLHKPVKDINSGIDKDELYKTSKEYEQAIIQEVEGRHKKRINAEASQQYFNKLNNVTSEKASDNGAPTEQYSAIAEKYKKEDELIQAEAKRRHEQEEQNRKNIERAQQHFNELNGIGTDSKSDNSKVTAENSLLAELAEKAHQKEMQEEFLNRKNGDNGNKNV